MSGIDPMDGGFQATNGFYPTNGSAYLTEGIIRRRDLAYSEDT